MRALAIIPALLIPIFAGIGSCAQNMQAQASQTSQNDCAVIAAVSKQHYKFGPDNVPPPLRFPADGGWRPQCDWSKYGLAFVNYEDSPVSKSENPRERMKGLDFHQPAYDGTGATIATSIMHGPLAGMGYECHLRSGVAGWTVSECKTAWVS